MAQYKPFSEDRKLSELGAPDNLFGKFIIEFNSNNNKKGFLNASEEFQAIKQMLDVERGGELYDQELVKINALTVELSDELNAGILSVQVAGQNNSYALLNNYIAFISRKINKRALGSLQILADKASIELDQQKKIYQLQAKSALNTERTCAL